MKTLTITELPNGGFFLTEGEVDVIHANPRDGNITICTELGDSYDYPNKTTILTGAVRAFFAPKPPTET